MRKPTSNDEQGTNLRRHVNASESRDAGALNLENVVFRGNGVGLSAEVERERRERRDGRALDGAVGRARNEGGEGEKRRVSVSKFSEGTAESRTIGRSTTSWRQCHG